MFPSKWRLCRWHLRGCQRRSRKMRNQINALLAIQLHAEQCLQWLSGATMHSAWLREVGYCCILLCNDTDLAFALKQAVCAQGFGKGTLSPDCSEAVHCTATSRPFQSFWCTRLPRGSQLPKQEQQQQLIKPPFCILSHICSCCRPLACKFPSARCRQQSWTLGHLANAY